MGDKLFAVPYDALMLDTDNHRYILDVSKEWLEQAPGFDKDNWPDFADEQAMGSTRSYWSQRGMGSGSMGGMGTGGDAGY